MLRSPNTFRKYHDAELTLHSKHTHTIKVTHCWDEYKTTGAVDLHRSGFTDLPGGVERQQLDPLLQHGLEAQGEREGNLSCRAEETTGCMSYT